MTAYTYNMVNIVLSNSDAPDWEAARKEWEVTGCEEDESCSGACVCGKKGLKYLYTIRNKETGCVVYPIGYSCIHKLGRSDLDEETACWRMAFVLMEEAVRLGKGKQVEIDSGFFSRRFLYFLYEQGAFKPSENGGRDGFKDYLFLQGALDRTLTGKQAARCRVLIRNSVYPWLRELYARRRLVKNG